MGRREGIRGAGGVRGTAFTAERVGPQGAGRVGTGYREVQFAGEDEKCANGTGFVLRNKVSDRSTTRNGVPGGDPWIQIQKPVLTFVWTF